MVSKHFDVNHNIKFVNYQDFKNNLKTILELNDIPIADPSIIPTNLLCKLTKKKVTVALSGDGADELLGGYDPFLALRPSKIYSKVIPTNIHKLILKLSNLLPVSSKNLSFDFKVKKTLGGLSYPQNIGLQFGCLYLIHQILKNYSILIYHLKTCTVRLFLILRKTNLKVLKKV